MRTNACFAGAAYTLGEQQRLLADLPRFEALLEERQIPFLPEVLGLGAYFATSDPYALAEESVRKTLTAASLEAQDIDCLLVASSNFPNDFEFQNRSLGGLLSRSGLRPRSTFAVSGTGCVALLSAVDLALGLLTARDLRHVLVVTIEYLPGAGDEQRLLSHAVLSDVAASVLVTQQTIGRGFSLSAYASESNVSQMLSGLRWDAEDLGLSVVTQALRAAGVRPREVSRLFGNNTFLPLKKNRERALGFNREQLYLENTKRIGHCLSADPLINWLDCVTEKEPSGPCVLYGEADGHSAALVVLPQGSVAWNAKA